MDIRQLHSEEFDLSMDLSEYAFQYKLPSEKRANAKERFKAERVWGAFEEGTLEAKLTLLPFEVYIQGRLVPMGGLAGVATWPENRRQGHVAKLLAHTLQTMNEAGQTLSFLHPFLIPFYRKFGWEVYCEYKKYSIPVAKFPKKVEVEGKVRRGVKDIEVLDNLYNRFAVRYNGTLKRDLDWWENSVLDDEGQIAVFYSQLGEPEGYVLYKIENRELVIDEFVFLNEQARQGLWTFLANHDSMVTGASLKLVPSDDMLPFLLPDPRIEQENYPYFMARIVNAKVFVESYSFKRHSSQKKQVIYIEDKYAPWNDGLWEWTVSEEGAAAFLRIVGERDAADLSCGIGTLTILMFGYKRPAELARYGLVTGNPTSLEWLEEIIPQAETALFDHF
ncbi:GNAT family N-acetyltransferase [Paenibacillus sp. FSL H7-0716]|uniref:GNAT family N-acetyltransferase n=1 Tax=Paenibacillus odorifer TaxID=189426 RepID=A0AB36J680_9BACL|nr:GNAT family N-acetyltransferase [Paenibacillus odorifer]OME12025.1 GNAT family N-acetyltransferase [Paenibacillus odorifer]